MPVTFNGRRIRITLDEFSGVVAPMLLRAQLQAVASVVQAVSTKVNPNGSGVCNVDTSAAVPNGERPAVLAAIAAHNPSSVRERPEPSPADVPRGRPGQSRYMRRAPKQGETVANASGTMVYWDHLGNLLRVSDDFILRSA